MDLKQEMKKLEGHLQKTMAHTSFYIKRMVLKVKKKLNELGSQMISPIEKGFKKAEVITPPKGSYEGVDLSVLPKYIAYKSALLREKLTLYYLVSAIGLLFFCHYFATRIEISNLHGKLREKEYILAPGVMDFTSASAQMIPNSYVHDAAMDFLSSLGNINSSNIDEQYTALKRFMSEKLKVQFEVDTDEWTRQVKSDSISQILKVTDIEITSNNDGAYRVIALGRADFYSDQQYLGHEDQVIEMILRLIPPESGKRWYLQITSLSWEKQENFKTKSNFSKKSSN